MSAVFNLLRSDWYRLIRGKALWVSLVVMALSCASFVGILSFAASPEFAQLANTATTMSIEELGEGGVHLSGKEHAWDQLRDELDEMSAREAGADSANTSSLFTRENAQVGLKLSTDNNANLSPQEVKALNNRQMESFTSTVAQCSGSLIGVLASIVFGLACMSDFSSGFAKTLLSSKSRRRDYYAEKILLAGMISALFLIVSMAALSFGFHLENFTYERAESVGDVVLWAFLWWLVTWAYTLLVGVAAWALRSTAATVAAALLISSTLLGQFFLTICMFLRSIIPPLAVLPNLFLANSLSLLGSGSAGLLEPRAGLLLPVFTPAAQIAFVAALHLVALGAIALTLCKRKDV